MVNPFKEIRVWLSTDFPTETYVLTLIMQDSTWQSVEIPTRARIEPEGRVCSYAHQNKAFRRGMVVAFLYVAARGCYVGWLTSSS
ncbi:hypothetical protein EGJ00_04455 [Pseudomonas saudiphocaensis]|nr:hypothetical protein EGJ00_04455 [Pseudomonas saudiphocaensis]